MLLREYDRGCAASFFQSTRTAPRRPKLNADPLASVRLKMTNQRSQLLVNICMTINQPSPSPSSIDNDEERGCTMDVSFQSCEISRGNHVRIVAFPGRASWSVVVTVALAQTTVLLSNGGETTSFAPLVDRVADPVNSWITANL
jgi:hypothetical protein